MFKELIGPHIDEPLIKAVQGDERRLYLHQEEAIRRVSEGYNVIVATGTGSGKTEAFLYPILLHLYREYLTGKLGAGVRALILYPMNALANDQRDRLASPPSQSMGPGILWTLSQLNSRFQFTFGQYIGETPEDENDSRRHARDHLANRLPGELVLRSEIRSTPPHILLTNYSMLEYLLLRPDDSPLFDKGQARWWTFLVLDEAHQYRGSRGIEMAMLLRRLKRRLIEGGRSGPFRCIATSATLAGGQRDRGAVAQFASDLFGEAFLTEDVILGETEPVFDSGANSLSLEDYRVLEDVMHGKNGDVGNHLAHMAQRLGVRLKASDDNLAAVGVLLQHDQRSSSLRALVTGNPGEVQEVGDQVFDELPSEERVPALSRLVQLLLHAKDAVSHSPLLSARYHLFLRSLEGAFVCYWPDKRVILDRKSIEGQGVAFEVALCRECGQHYFVAQKGFKGGKLAEAMRDPSHDNFGATFLRPIEGGGGDQDDEDDSGTHTQVFQLCVRCGEMSRINPPCGHDNSIKVVKEEAASDEDKADQMAKCGACGYNAAGRDPVREVVYGTDGPHAVIATTLYQELPEKRKKVLAFADGRQEAAFFAWYLEDSYKQMLGRNLVLKVVKSLSPHTPEGLSLRELAIGLRDVFRERDVFPPAMGELDLRREAWLRVYAEFLTDEPRISLEGVGLVHWSVKWPGWFKIPEVLANPPWSLSESEIWDLLLLVLDSMRADRAIELRTDKGVSVSWADLGLQAAQKCYRIGAPKGRKDVTSWDGKFGKRARLLAKLLCELSEQTAVDNSITALRSIWETFRNCDENAPSPQDRLLLPIGDARRLNPDWWRLHLILDQAAIYECNTCGRLQSVSVRGICPRHHCPGTLQEKKPIDLEPNHYRLLYEEELPGALSVEEHTAQLDHEKAREFQRSFRQGKIHVLSCSTTFELGVDLGDLDTTFLRNVPPEAFNYAQRVGRVGRRSGYPGFAITYCRRNPHDLYHFAEPRRMLSGRVQPPVLSLRNEKIISRHIAATALSAFFRACPERFQKVESLCREMVNPTGVADFKAYLYQHRAELEESLHVIVPRGMDADIGLKDGTWMDRIAGDGSRCALAETEVCSDYRNVLDLRKKAQHTNDDRTYVWAGARAKTIAEEDVLSFLSRKAVIPKYGFPVDVVELDTQRILRNQEAFEVSLQRDLTIAVSEFAPSSKLVANKKVWTSYGLKRVAEKEWDRWWYARCATHARFERKHHQKEEPSFEKCCDKMVVHHQYVDPKFGFVTSRQRPEAPKTRPAKVFTTRPYFAGFRDCEGDRIDFDMVHLTTVSPGYMVVLCEGRRGEGFYICGQCGAGFRQPKEFQKGHETPYGEKCSARPESLRPPVSLGHELVSDVLKLQFRTTPEDEIAPAWFAFSLAYALVEGAAETLEVPSTDLNATVAHSGEEQMIPAIILYDNVPGGAGLVASLQKKEVLRVCLEAAAKRVAGNCGCGEKDSCYGCLRSYRNQFAHQYLQRGPVLRYLERLLSEWK